MPRKKKIEWEEIYELEIVKKARRWNRHRDVDTIEGINRRIELGGFPEVVRDADRAYEATIWQTAGEILKYRDRLRLVIVAGPSSSGKTTTTLKTCECLKTMGERLKLLALDNYFWNLADQPRDRHGDYNFETPRALDIEGVNRNIKELLAGKETIIPIYDFKTGRRREEGTKMRMEKGELLVVEGLHGLHSEMTECVPPDEKFRVYIEAVCQLKSRAGDFIPWTDIRLLRRMVRDNLHRNYPPLKTVGHWHYVRKSEKEHIVPFIKDADMVINGYLPYELPIHKKYLYHSLKEAVSHFHGEKERADAFKRASRCLSWLEEVTAWEDDSIIPPDSLLREFIGGGIYH